MGMRYLLVMGATMALRERAIVAALRGFDGPVATVSPGPRTRYGTFFDHVVPGVPSDPEAALRAVLDFEKETGLSPAGVVPFVDGLLVAGLTIAEHYGLPYLSRAAVEDSSINKDRMKDLLLAAGIATPRYLKVDSVEAVRAAIDEVGLPCVIKPSAFGGSLGVRLVRAGAEAAEAFGYVRRIIDETAATFSVRNRSVQVEEFCPLADEVSVEVLNHGQVRIPLAVVDKSLGPRPYFAEIGHRVPSRYTGRQDVLDLAVAACAAIGLDRGMAHVELRLEHDRAPAVMEVGARTAGDGILDLVERAHGVSGNDLHVRSYLDRLDQEQLGALAAPTAAGGVAALAVLKAPAGRITAVAAPERVDPAVTNLEISAGVGDVSAAESANYLTREGYVECFWPGARPSEVPAQAHLAIAAGLAGQIFTTEDPPA